MDGLEAITLGQDAIEFANFDDFQIKSQCQIEWMHYKEETGVENYFVEKIMALPSREDVKYLFFDTVKRVKLAESIGHDLCEEDFSVVFLIRGVDEQSCGKTKPQSAVVGSAATLEADWLFRCCRYCATLRQVACLTRSGRSLPCSLVRRRLLRMCPFTILHCKAPGWPTRESFLITSTILESNQSKKMCSSTQYAL